MYRLLEVGEVIEKGDEYWWSNRWNPIVPSCFGCKVKLIDPIRRLAKPAVTTAASSVPDPVVSVGDRVKVLSGPWAGCTGVVIALDACVLLSDYGKMTAQYDSTPVIELEHVRVGGDKLILSKVTVDKLPPVVSEVLYRDLSHGETIRNGDEHCYRDKWEPVSGSVGAVYASYHLKIRRPVRLQSPGWRYLDAGETVQAGDETPVEILGWRRLPITNGMTVGNEKLFRRKLPANQGG